MKVTHTNILFIGANDFMPAIFVEQFVFVYESVYWFRDTVDGAHQPSDKATAGEAE